jgi:release factor glutamine methyltransferase
MEYRSDIDIVECDLVYPPLEDTFLLLECLHVKDREKTLEMGCGTGLISCHLSKNGAKLTAADINPLAVQCTEKNLRRNGLEGEAVLTDLFHEIDERFDLIVFNPPYLAAEEEGMLEAAWAGGKEGLDVIAPFLNQAPDHLNDGGRIVLLLSSEMDAEGLENLLEPFSRLRLGSRHYFYEDLWVEELRPR